MGRFWRRSIEVMGRVFIGECGRSNVREMLRFCSGFGVFVRSKVVDIMGNQWESIVRDSDEYLVMNKVAGLLFSVSNLASNWF